jgi:FG-GAP-like repeat
MGVVAADVNRDGRIDLYVANDMCPHFLFLNKGDGTFNDVTDSSGAAVTKSGHYQGGMGVDVEDFDGDGYPELFVTNFDGEYNTIHQTTDGQTFEDISAAAGIVRESIPEVGWGFSLADFEEEARRLALRLFKAEPNEAIAWHKLVLENYPKTRSASRLSDVWRGRAIVRENTDEYRVNRHIRSRMVSITM